MAWAVMVTEARLRKPKPFATIGLAIPNGTTVKRRLSILWPRQAFPLLFIGYLVVVRNCLLSKDEVDVLFRKHLCH